MLVMFESFDDFFFFFFCCFVLLNKLQRRQTKKSHECDIQKSRPSWLESENPRAAPPLMRG